MPACERLLGSVASIQRNSGITECTTGAAGRADDGMEICIVGAMTLWPSSRGLVAALG
jgi:hypothetical protein